MSTSGSKGTPGGADKQVQFNDSGVFGTDTNILWDKGPQALNLQGAINGGPGFTGPTLDVQNGYLYDTGGNAVLSYASSQMLGLWSLDYDKIILKSADQTVTSGIALQSDSELLVQVDDTAKYQFEIVAYATANVSGGIKAAVTGPALTGAGFVIYNTMITTTDVFSKSKNSTTYNAGTGITAVSADITVVIRGTIYALGNTGNLIFRWAQNAFNASATTVLKGSYLKLRRIV